MKRFFSIFHLKPNEQRLVVLVIVALLAWAWLKHQHQAPIEASAPPASAPPNE